MIGEFDLGFDDALDEGLHAQEMRLLGGLEFKAHRLLDHSTLGLRVLKKKKRI